MWRSWQACWLCPWARYLTGRLHLYVTERWPTRTLREYNCEVANPACRKRRLLGTHQWQSVLLVVRLPVIHDWFEMGCHLSPSLILIRLTAFRTSIPRKRRGNHKQTNRCSAGIRLDRVLFSLHPQLLPSAALFYDNHLVI